MEDSNKLDKQAKGEEKKHINTQCYLPEIRRGIRQFAFSILCGLLFASQLVFPSLAFALSAKTDGSADPPPALAQSEVSVVRLVSNYTPKTVSSTTSNQANALLCTSLGVLAKSWPARSPADFNSWVLTGASLLTTTPPSCAPANSTGKPASYTLSTINVYANNVYTGTLAANALLGTYRSPNPVTCTVPRCLSGAVLFALHTDHPEPTLDVAPATTTPAFGIALTNGVSPTTRPLQPLQNEALVLQFLNPTVLSPAATNSQNEVGMPLLNSAGQFVEMSLQGATQFTAADYTAFLTQHSPFASAPANPLQVAWESGMTAYYSQRYSEAVTDFEHVEILNPALKAATTFKQMATAHLNSSQGNITGTNPATSSRSTFLIVGIAAGFLLLIVLLVIVNVWKRRRHELARFQAEQAEAQRTSERDVQQQRIAQQNNEPVEKPKQVSLIRHRTKSGVNVSTTHPQSPANQLCPNCGHAILAGATYCPNCRYQLSPIARDAPPTSNIPPATEFPVIGKVLPSSATTSQPQLTPVEETVLDNLGIQEALKRLWDRAERSAS